MTTDESPYDVLVVGGSGVDTVVRVDSLPVPLVDSLGVEPVREWPGQTGGNVALGCRALGMSVKFLDFVGEDWVGTMLRERLAKGDVDFEPLISPAGTRRAVNLVDATGHRMSFYDGRDPSDLRMPREFYLPHLRRARHVHLSISHFTRFLYDDIEELGLPVSTDLHDWDGLAEHQREFARRSDLVFLSAAGAGERIADVMRGILRDGRAQAVIATAGAGGAYLLARDGEARPGTSRPPPRPARWWTPTARATPSSAASSTGACAEWTSGPAPASARARVRTPARRAATWPSSTPRRWIPLRSPAPARSRPPPVRRSRRRPRGPSGSAAAPAASRSGGCRPAPAWS